MADRSAPHRAQVPARARPTIFVTGAGTAAGVTLIRALTAHASVVAGDSDPLAVGLYLVPFKRRVLLPQPTDPDFATSLIAAAQRHGVDLVIPTLDGELPVVSATRADFARAGIRLLVESARTLDVCQDTVALIQRCAPQVRVPDTALFDGALLDALDGRGLERFGNRFVVKSRRAGTGGAVAVITDPDQLLGHRLDGSCIVQEYLPGTRYSIDVLARPDGHVVATVPRTRDRVHGGIAVAGRTVHDAGLQSFARRVAEAVGATGVVNVHVRCDEMGAPALLGVIARFPATMMLTMAAGIDMPALAVSAALGHRLPDSLDFREVAVVQHWAEVAIPVAEYGRLTDAGLPVSSSVR